MDCTFPSELLHVYLATDTCGPILAAGVGPTGPWPLMAPVRQPGELPAVIERWCALWGELTGQVPVLMTADERLAPLSADDRVSDPSSVLQEHLDGAAALDAALKVLGESSEPRSRAASLPTAIVLLRLWARWLRRFEGSSVPYLLDHFVRRPGRIAIRDHAIVVSYDRRPLDVLLDVAGYQANLERVSWMNGRAVRFAPC